MGRRLLLQLLVALLLLGVLPPPVRAPVLTVVVTTDRTDYVQGMVVTATAAIVIDPPPNNADEPVVVEWFDATWTVLRSETALKVSLTQRDWQSVASWTPPNPGDFHVNVTSNETNGNPPRIFGSAPFRVWDPQDYVIARDIRVATDRLQYERFQVATATADVTVLPGEGNVSRLESVRFEWFNPSGGLVRQFVNGSLAAGRASDTYVPSLIGNYSINVTYLENDTASNTTVFSVVVQTTLATDVAPGQSVTWDALRVWRVCSDLLVAATGALTIEAGTTVRFCRGSRLRVEGSLTADGSLSAPITLTSYESPPAPGDWNGIRFEPDGTGRLVDAIVEFVTDGVVAVGSSPLLVGLTARLGVGEAVNLTDSGATVRGAAITGFARGIRLGNATALVESVFVDGPAREGVFVTDSSGALFRGLQVAGGNVGFAAVSSDGLLVDAANLTDAAIRAVDLKVSTVTFVNSSIASGPGGQDFLLVASDATFLNCVFTDVPAKRTIVTPSRLIVQNFLAVEVEVLDGTPVAGARVAVTVDGQPLPARTTSGAGVAAWIVVEDRVYTATTVAKRAVVVSVIRDGYSITGSPRTVDMLASHTERFVATPLGETLLGVDVRLLGGLLLAALLLPFLFVLWRRRAKPEAESEGPVSKPLVGRPVRQGECYAILAEKPDSAFERFAIDVAAGVPGLCITRIRPEDARARYGLRGVPVHWLSRSFGKEVLNPTNLGAIVELVQGGTKGKPACRVLLDGLEYLYTQNDFGKVVKFVQALADVTAEHRAVLFLPVNPKSLDADRLAILTRDLQTWR